MLLSTQIVPAAVPMAAAAPLPKSAEAEPLRVVFQGLRLFKSFHKGFDVLSVGPSLYARASCLTHLV